MYSTFLNLPADAEQYCFIASTSSVYLKNTVFTKLVKGVRATGDNSKLEKEIEVTLTHCINGNGRYESLRALFSLKYNYIISCLD